LEAAVRLIIIPHGRVPWVRRPGLGRAGEDPGKDTRLLLRTQRRYERSRASPMVTRMRRLKFTW